MADKTPFEITAVYTLKKGADLIEVNGPKGVAYAVRQKDASWHDVVFYSNREEALTQSGLEANQKTEFSDAKKTKANDHFEDLQEAYDRAELQSTVTYVEVPAADEKVANASRTEGKKFSFDALLRGAAKIAARAAGLGAEITYAVNEKLLDRMTRAGVNPALVTMFSAQHGSYIIEDAIQEGIVTSVTGADKKSVKLDANTDVDKLTDAQRQEIIGDYLIHQHRHGGDVTLPRVFEDARVFTVEGHEGTFGMNSNGWVFEWSAAKQGQDPTWHRVALEDKKNEGLLTALKEGNITATYPPTRSQKGGVPEEVAVPESGWAGAAVHHNYAGGIIGLVVGALIPKVGKLIQGAALSLIGAQAVYDVVNEVQDRRQDDKDYDPARPANVLTWIADKLDEMAQKKTPDVEATTVPAR